ncbi:MAG TPA: PQQ-binding-like beta-propeller repeat protein, partial [Solirubrobacterales bacterium]|nr:PQQ-binding-like beta-propeller repeat protein [Solirubrobacterales bacterium]
MLVVALALVAGGSVAPGPALADGPLLQGSPWPEMRHDLRNTGESQIRGAYRGERPWSFTTQRGIFSTPVIDDRGGVYVGSADGNFYALGRDGSKLWRFRTGGIIDAAAALGLRAGPKDEFPITIGSGDETLYQLRGTPRQLSAAKRTRWTFRTPLAPATGQLVNWWEGNVAYGPDSNLYVGNTGGGAFSLTPEGEQRWVTQRANSVWTTPAFDAEGNSYWGSVDFYAFSLDPAGNQRWQTFTPGYLTSSPALGSDGTVYIGSFDRSLHALDPATGAERWAFPTADHIYSSPALASDAAGNTKAIYIGSADGSIYAVAPDGTELWSYDTGDPVRSSPVLGRAPKGAGKIVYVGSSTGVLDALDAETGRRRWSFDTTPGKAGRADRNDLNGSPALGKRGVYIGGEHGRVWFVPYDLCLEVDHRRCTTDPSPEFRPTVTRTFAPTPGGTTLRGSPENVPAATTLAARLVVRRDGETIDAAIDPASLSLTPKPSFTFTSELSG